MNTKYLSGELKKWIKLQDDLIDSTLSRFGKDKSTINFINQKVIPVIKNDVDHQTNIVVREAERLLKKYEYEKNTKTKTN